MRRNLSKLRVYSLSYLILMALSSYALAEPVNPVTPMTQEQVRLDKIAQFFEWVQPLLQTRDAAELTPQRLNQIQALYQSIEPKPNALQQAHSSLLQRVYQLAERNREALSATVLDLDMWTQTLNQLKWLTLVSEQWPAPYFSLSKIFELQDDLQNAAVYQTQGLALYLNHSTEMNLAYVHTQHLMRILLTQGQKEQALLALKNFESFVQNLKPKDPNLPKIALHQQLFLLKVHQDMLRLYIDDPKVLPQYPQALYELHPNDPLMAYLYAIYLKDKSPQLARELLQQVMASSSPNSKLYRQAQNLFNALT